jgi:Kef-type K+ transport system membrane component KefB
LASSGIIILFSAGLHFTFSSLKNAGINAIIVGTVDVITPIVFGY